MPHPALPCLRPAEIPAADPTSAVDETRSGKTGYQRFAPPPPQIFTIPATHKIFAGCTAEQQEWNRVAYAGLLGVHPSQVQIVDEDGDDAPGGETCA